MTKNSNFQSGVFYFKLYDLLGKLSNYQDNPNFEAFFNLDAKLSEESLKAVKLNFNVFKMVVTKNWEQLSLANKEFVSYLKIYLNILTGQGFLEEYKGLQKNQNFVSFSLHLMSSKKYAGNKEIQDYFPGQYLAILEDKNHNPDWENLSKYLSMQIVEVH